jgi:hypothetical protein
MSLPSTLTLNSVSFDEKVQLSGTSVVYYAASPNDDLFGRPSLRISTEITKAGIARTLVSLNRPIYDDSTGKYNGFTKTDLVINRAVTAPITDLDGDVHQIKDLLGVTDVIHILTLGAI